MRQERENWSELVQRLSTCELCHGRGLLHAGARPLFARFRGLRSDVLFVLEAPNHADTFDEGKGYLSVDCDTDPSGRFFAELHTEVLGEPIEQAVLTNAVLCLPAGAGGRYPVTATTMRNCSGHLASQIRSLDPLIVVTLGAKALGATRLLEDHGLRTLADAAAAQRQWYGRMLFPLYHTGLLARNGPTGRPAAQQREDWSRLRELLAERRREARPH